MYSHYSPFNLRVSNALSILKLKLQSITNLPKHYFSCLKRPKDRTAFNSCQIKKKAAGSSFFIDSALILGTRYQINLLATGQVQHLQYKQKKNLLCALTLTVFPFATLMLMGEISLPFSGGLVTLGATQALLHTLVPGSGHLKDLSFMTDDRLGWMQEQSKIYVLVP